MNRTAWGVVLALGVGGLVLGWRFAFPSESGPSLRVTQVEGNVSLERVEQGRADAVPGTLLQPSDRVATGAESRATLSLGAETEIRLRPDSTVQVVDYEESSVTMELDRGALTATVRRDADTVRVRNAGREVIAKRGIVDVGVDDDVLQVRAREGEVELMGADPTTVREGEEAVVAGATAWVTPIPEALTLEVQWPETDTRTRARESAVVGSTRPGAQVRVTGSFGTRTMRANDTGSFRIQVPLDEGDNRVEVWATDALGRERRIDGRLETRDTRGPTLRTGTRLSRGGP